MVSRAPGLRTTTERRPPSSQPPSAGAPSGDLAARGKGDGTFATRTGTGVWNGFHYLVGVGGATVAGPGGWSAPFERGVPVPLPPEP